MMKEKNASHLLLHRQIFWKNFNISIYEYRKIIVFLTRITSSRTLCADVCSCFKTSSQHHKIKNNAHLNCHLLMLNTYHHSFRTDWAQLLFLTLLFRLWYRESFFTVSFHLPDSTFKYLAKQLHHSISLAATLSQVSRLPLCSYMMPY